MVEGVPVGEPEVLVIDEESSEVVPDAEGVGEAVPEGELDSEELEVLSLAKYCH